MGEALSNLQKHSSLRILDTFFDAGKTVLDSVMISFHLLRWKLKIDKITTDDFFYKLCGSNL